jgi:hypothetical protein
MSETANDICIRLKVLNPQHEPLGGTVDLEFKPKEVGRTLTVKAVDASKDIDVRGLQRTPKGLYTVTVTPTDVFKPTSQFVTIPASGFITVEFVVDKGRGTPTGGGGESDGICVRIRVLNPQGHPLGGAVDVVFKPKEAGATVNVKAVDASKDIDVRGLQRAPKGLYTVTVTPTDVFKPTSQFVTIPASDFNTVEFIIDKGGAMQSRKVCDLTDKLISCSIGFSDRYVYSGYFVPLPLNFEGSAVPILTHLQKTMLVPYLTMAEQFFTKPEQMAALNSVLEMNDLVKLKEKLTQPQLNVALDRRSDNFERQVSLLQDVVRQVTVNLGDIGATISAQAATNPAASVTLKMLEQQQDQLMAVTADLTSTSYAASAAAQLLSSMNDATQQQQREMMSDEQRLDLLLNLLKTQIGWLFLDRTRIRPIGYAVGEHVHSLSLAPGEELVVEQKAFSKRQATYDELTEQERQFDLELSSSLSTELQEGLDEQVNRNATNGQGFGAISGFDVQLNLFDIVNLQKFKTTEASNDTKRRSVKDSQSATAKIAAKYRALHKIEFKVTREEGFESTSRRTLRNPSKYTPMQLHYFKILRKMEMKQERHGVRLCWTPCLQDPGRDVFKRMQEGRAAILRAAEVATPIPDEPKAPTPASRPATAATNSVTVTSWNPDGGTDTNVFVPVPITSDYVWDQSLANIKVSVDTEIDRNRIVTLRRVGATQIGPNIRVQVRLIVTPRTNWFNLAEYSPVKVVAEIRLIPDPATVDPEFRKELDAWRIALREWEKQVAEMQLQARASALAAADAWENETLQSVNALSEMMGRIINERFDDPAFRDECWEVDLWHKVFDWGAAAYRLYPAWWTKGQMRDPARDPSHLYNASWARLYIPINIGYEEIALRWIFGRVVSSTLPPRYEAAFDAVVADLNEYRNKWFGAEEVGINPEDECPEYNEKTICLARWSELLPTDGTHLEIVQSATAAVDDYTQKDLDDTVEFRKAALDAQQADVDLKEKIGNQINQPVDVKVIIPGERTPPA